MKNIYIGDIHGRISWKLAIEQHPDADNIVFVGDYFDSFDIPGVDQLHNAEEIVRFKRERELDPTKKVYLLIGNHDIHYWPGNKDGGGTSGYQPKMRHSFEMFFRENEDMFQMSVTIGNCLCTHAGVSSQFLKDTGYWTYNNHTDESHVSEFLNDLFKYKPNEFLFHAAYDRHYGLLNPDSYGDDEFQSPIWIRPKSLKRSNAKSDLKKMYIQIVGHTQQDKIDIKGKSTGGRYYFIDTLPSGEYLVEIDGKFETKNINPYL
jgi:predicted phosphodiesterase